KARIIANNAAAGHSGHRAFPGSGESPNAFPAMSPLAPPAPIVERFRRDWEALAGPPARLGVAVSGGPDSIALLLLACAAFPGAVEASTVDHGLRAASAEEAVMVAAICA